MTYKSLKGKDPVVHRMGFGEFVLYRKKLVQNKLAKLISLWEDGRMEVQRRPPMERWDSRAVDRAGGGPWNTSLDDPDVDGPGQFVSSWGADDNEQGAHETADVALEAAPRRAQITRQDLQRFGFTAGCPGCLQAEAEHREAEAEAEHRDAQG